MVKQWIMAAITMIAVGAPAALEAQMAVGIRGGIRWASLRGEQETDGGTGLLVGGYAGFGLADQLAIQLEVNYGARSVSGLRVGANELDATASPSDLQMRYIEVPILLRVGFPGERLLPSFFAGPYAGFLLSCDLVPDEAEGRSCDERGEAGSETEQQSGVTQPPWFNPRGTDVGMVFGAGLDLALGAGSVFLDARYAVGLLSIHSGDAFSTQHAGLDFTGGFAFPIGR